jgi:dsRNA-specific ribonuclease
MGWIKWRGGNLREYVDTSRSNISTIEITLLRCILLTLPQADNLHGSGLDAVLSTTLYAIVGAIALERGGEVANKITQDKILKPLGFSFSSEEL